MILELQYLLFAVILAFVQVVIAAAAANQSVGLSALAGNREDMPPLTGFAGRAKRAHLNMLESLPLFIALVLIVAVAGKHNTTTQLGATLFFWGRLVHAVIYLLGLPWLRTLAWAVSVVGLIMMAVVLLGAF